MALRVTRVELSHSAQGPRAPRSRGRPSSVSEPDRKPQIPARLESAQSELSLEQGLAAIHVFVVCRCRCDSSLTDNRSDGSGYSSMSCSPAELVSASPVLRSFSLRLAAVKPSAANRNCASFSLFQLRGALQFHFRGALHGIPGIPPSRFPVGYWFEGFSDPKFRLAKNFSMLLH
jgi:hypothetical protein